MTDTTDTTADSPLPENGVTSMALTFQPRPSQREILAYQSGLLGISAVPGSGKTHMLSALAAKLLRSGKLARDQEILIVTLVNSAVDNFTARLSQFQEPDRLLPQQGFRVRTLHGLAHDIVRENPPLVGLDKQFVIIDETASTALIREAARRWVAANSDFLVAYVAPSLAEHQRRRVTQRDWPELVENIAASFIRFAKDREASPEAVRLSLQKHPAALPLAEMGFRVYDEYQRALVYRGAVDFDDLVRLAARMLDASEELRERLHYRWPFVLEDEAQDSSALQQRILSMLVGPHGNWVRVGDPNQAIFETFTTANPELLRAFSRQHAHLEMPESGRCQPSIIDLANHLIEWTVHEHPFEAARTALDRPYIQLTPRDDPQSNPPDDPEAIALYMTGFRADKEAEFVSKSIQDWVPSNTDKTVAVLSSTNDHAARVVQALQSRNIAYRELLKSTSPTRAVAGSLSYVLGYLADPDSSRKLSQAYKVWRRDWRQASSLQSLYTRVSALLYKLGRLEELLAPKAGSKSENVQRLDVPWPVPSEGTTSEDLEDQVRAELDAFCSVVGTWHGATYLPIDQLMLTIAADIFHEPAELALAHKLALVMRQMADENPAWRLPELTPSLLEIARNERRFVGFSEDDSGFDPNQYKGIVIVSTMHKAKGLEWDRVYLLSVNDYDFPSGQESDSFISERWFVRDRLNLEAEALQQLGVAQSSSEYESYQEGGATAKARLDYVSERLRLLYVGITRARRELIITWNTGRRGSAGPALPLVALQTWWDREHPRGEGV